jgi:hypothetical protein
VTNFDRSGIAERLRSLIAGQDDGDLSATAARLGLEELSLRMSIDEVSPHPTVEVLAAVIRVYGVDPTWLLTGVYDASTHRTCMDEPTTIAAMLREYIHKRSPLIAEHTAEHFYRQN